MIISTYQLVTTISLNSIQAEDGDFQFKLKELRNVKQHLRTITDPANAHCKSGQCRLVPGQEGHSGHMLELNTWWRHCCVLVVCWIFFFFFII